MNNYTKQRLYYFIMLLILFSINTLSFAQTINSPQHADIEVFVRQGCPHCKQAENFLDKLKIEQTDLTIIIHDVSTDKQALQQLQTLAEQLKVNNVRVPAFYINGQLIIGYSDEISTGQWIKDALIQQISPPSIKSSDNGSCEAVESLSCEAPKPPVISQKFNINFLGQSLSLDDIGLPLFTLAMGLLDGFNPCSMWVLILMISLLAPLGNRKRMFIIAGTFVVIEGIAYFMFMAAWLNLFLFIGLSRISEIIIALIALVAGLINLKDFFRYGWGVSLSIPASAKPNIYAQMRRILQAQSLFAAIIGVIILALLVQIVEFLCTSGFPALFTRILTLKQLDSVSYYSYLL
ncbi:MAG: glutaredoxin, partial [Methylococcaceae bacterium]